MKSKGYNGKIVRMNLSNKTVTIESLSDQMACKFIGGTGLIARTLYDEVLAGVEWDDPDNRLIVASGPIGGTVVNGSGTYSVGAKGCMTNLAGVSQANGFLGAYLKKSGFDAVIVEGRSEKLQYLFIHDGKAEIRDASDLSGKTTFETETILKRESGMGNRLSVHCIGPAGENGVRFAMIAGDGGHCAAHNGLGAVMGAKGLKAFAIGKGTIEFPIHDKEALSKISKDIVEDAIQTGSKSIYAWGTGGVFTRAAQGGYLPVRNYTTNVFLEHEFFDGRYIRNHFEHRDKPCWRCKVRHTKFMKVTEGPYAGVEGEEPEYEALAAFGPQIGNTDPGAVVMLTNETDGLGLDVNETGWVIGWVMECYEKGILSREDLDGLEMTWGNVEDVRTMLHKIARREGIGELLSDGVMRASRKLGGEAPNLGVYTMKGASPRTHDHRGRWCEFLDTCFGNTSTIEASAGGVFPERSGYPPVTDPYDPVEVALVNARENGWRQFEDSLVLCRFCITDRHMMAEAVNYATGWDLDLSEALKIGKRIVNQLRVFNFIHGLDEALENPSYRYAITPVDGPVAGRGIRPYWDQIKRAYYRHMGWDPETGKPLPDTLRSLGLEELVGVI